jgi:hypothetical protein
LQSLEGGFTGGHVTSGNRVGAERESCGWEVLRREKEMERERKKEESQRWSYGGQSNKNMRVVVRGGLGRGREIEIGRREKKTKNQ